MKNYNFNFEKRDHSFIVTVPSLRLDLRLPEDMAEEIGRIYGYDKIIPTIPKINFAPKDNVVYTKIKSIRADLIAKGYKEVMTYSFTNKGEIEVLASASDKNFLRTNLSDGLKASFEMNRLNMPILGLDEIKIFEIGTVFTKSGEEMHVAYTEKKEIKEINIKDYVVESAEEISRSGRGEAEEIRGPEIFSADGTVSTFKSWSTFPFITRDISVWAGEETTEEILKNLYQKNGTELLIMEPRLVDKFEKNGRTSYAFRLVFQAPNRTLTDAEINGILEQINSELSKLPNIEIR